MINRRNLLKASGISLALPALEALSAPKAVASPKRMVCIGNSFGMYGPKFFPAKAGPDYTITPILKPLEAHRKDFSIFSHLDHDVKGGHYAVHSFLSGVKHSNASAMPDGNITLDQRAAEVIGLETRFPSLTIGSETGLHGGCRMSWTRTGVRVPPLKGPREVFRKLFREEDAAGKVRASDQFKLQGSILDALLGEANTLGKRVSGRDREKLDEYFSSIRDVERRIQQQEKWHSIPKPKTELEEPSNTNFFEDIPMLYELLVLALETDTTRVATFEMAGAQFNTSLLDLKDGYHALSHHGQVEKNIAGLVKLETYQMQQLSIFLDRLKSAKNADGSSLLDRTSVLFGSGMGNANSHTNSDLPIILAGGGYKLGEHRIMDEEKNKRVPLCNLYLSLLQRMGVEDERFGLSTGTLTGLEGGA